MLVQKDFLNKLKEFGLNSYEAKLWAALLSRGISTAGELSDLANVPRSRSYDVLESLEKKGFVVMKLGKPIKFIAVPPEEVIERVKKGIIEEAESQAELVDGFKKSGLLEQLNTIYKQGITSIKPEEISGSLKGRKNIYNQMESAISNAKKSVVIVTTPQALLRKKELLAKTFKKAKQKGVSIRIAAPLNGKLVKDVEEIKNHVNIGNTSINARFMVIDSQQAIFSINDEKDPTLELAIWTNSPFFASTLQNFFETIWKDAKQL